MTNNTKDTITTGLSYRIEAFEKDKWTEVSPDMAFNDIGFLLRPTDSKDFDIRLLRGRINYKIGKYRIVKYYLRSDYSKSKERYDLYAEFNIESE